MKKISASLFISLLMVAATALGATVYVDGSGSEYGTCTESNFYFCVRGIADRAKSSALNDAEFRCSLSRGKVELFSESCQDSCSPWSYPSGQPTVSANCRVTCRVRCQVP